MATTLKKAKQGCWTCKRRKIGCDKTLPWCAHCTGTGRECLGYGMRLLWPDHYDGRRRDGNLTVHVPTGNASQRSEHYGLEFLNATFGHVEAARDRGAREKTLAVMPRARPGRTLATHAPIRGHDSHFMSYYEKTISSMISTVQVDNGFRVDLLPMALSRKDPSASALCNAMMAVSAFHNWGAEAALHYKSKARNFLSESLSNFNSDPGVLQTQAAASMMLCVYSVFDEMEGHWHLYLDGAKRLLQKLYMGGNRPSDFLFTWFLYHEVLGCFTKPFRERDNEIDLLSLLDYSTSDKTLIIGSLGCSVEILEAIHIINILRASIIHGSRKIDLIDMINKRKRIEHHLQTLTQNLSTEEQASSTPQRTAFILATAELYRLATLLYLQRVCSLPQDETTRPSHVDQAFATLSTLEVATSPWPLFVLACESRTDNQRIEILRTLDRMDTKRNIGNVLVLRSIIESFWNQCDLRADVSSGSPLRWWEMINYETAMPWFI